MAYCHGLFSTFAYEHLPLDDFGHAVIGFPSFVLYAWYCVCEWLAYATAFSLPVWLALMGSNFARRHRTDWRVPSVFYTLGWGMMFFLNIADPSGIFAWWMD